MHTEDTALAGSQVRPQGAPPLTVVVPLGEAPRTPANGQQVGLPVVSGEPSERSLSVQYQLDQESHRWVASILDETSGEVVTTVPSTQVLHLLAFLRHPPLDLRA